MERRLQNGSCAYSSHRAALGKANGSVRNRKVLSNRILSGDGVSNRAVTRAFAMKHDRSRQNDAREITQVTPKDRFKVPTTSPLPFNDFISVLELSALNFYFRYL
jgi:hypothetical protein